MIRALPTLSLPRCPETPCLELSPAEPRRHGTNPSRENPRRAQCSGVPAAPYERSALLRRRRGDVEEEEEATSKRNAADEEAMYPDITGSDAPEVAAG
uniref:Uncharacterized protein n=1 Tax=Aegilops tauschii TaxID=37682 RepID=M8BMK0_AEGTA